MLFDITKLRCSPSYPLLTFLFARGVAHALSLHFSRVRFLFAANAPARPPKKVTYVVYTLGAVNVVVVVVYRQYFLTEIAPRGQEGGVSLKVSRLLDLVRDTAFPLIHSRA